MCTVKCSPHNLTSLLHCTCFVLMVEIMMARTTSPQNSTIPLGSKQALSIQQYAQLPCSPHIVKIPKLHTVRIVFCIKLLLHMLGIPFPWNSNNATFLPLGDADLGGRQKNSTVSQKRMRANGKAKPKTLEPNSSARQPLVSFIKPKTFVPSFF